MLQVLVRGDIDKALQTLHRDLAHVSVGSLLRTAETRYWHPDLVLAAQEATVVCPRCQLMKPPTVTLRLPSLRPIVAPSPFFRWGMDWTGPIGNFMIVTAIEYATGLAIVDVAAAKKPLAPAAVHL